MHPALGAQSLNHWTPREVPCIFFRLVYLEGLSDPVFLQQDCIYVGVSGGACHQRQDISKMREKKRIGMLGNLPFGVGQWSEKQKIKMISVPSVN